MSGQDDIEATVSRLVSLPPFGESAPPTTFSVRFISTSGSAAFLSFPPLSALSFDVSVFSMVDVERCAALAGASERLAMEGRT